MNDFLTQLLLAVVSAVIPTLAGYAIVYIRELRDKAVAQTDSIKQQGYITEIADAVSVAVSVTSQTYVDSLKASGSFDKDAQIEAAQMALTAAVKALSPAAKEFIETMYGDLTEYLTNRIEAEVRNQKTTTVTALPAAVVETTATDTTAVAASTAAATAAAVVQTAIAQNTDK